MTFETLKLRLAKLDNQESIVELIKKFVQDKNTTYEDLIKLSAMLQVLKKREEENVTYTKT
jgi:hypothetical protein